MPQDDYPDFSKVHQAQSDVATLRDKVKRLEQRVEKQAAVLRALCEQAFQKQVLTEADVLTAMARIERERAGAPRECCKCERTLKANVRKCLYCGYEKPADSVVDLI